MIKEYSRFLSLINEENTTDLDSANRVNTYYLSNFVSKGPKIDSLTYFSDSSAREVFKTKLKGYLASDPIEGWGAGASYDKLLFTLDFFLKTRMWNKLVDILYGKDFSGDPLNNDIKLKGIKELYEDIPLQFLRFLDRINYIQDREIRVYNDGQNVHNSNVNISIRTSISNILLEDIIESFDCI
jgi:hypothetical protein